MVDREVPAFYTGAQKARELVTLFSEGNHWEMIKTADGMNLKDARAAAEFLAPALVSSLRMVIGPEATDEFLRELWAHEAAQDEEDLQGFHKTVDEIMGRYGRRGGVLDEHHRAKDEEE